MHIRNTMAFGHDVTAAMLAWYLAYWRRLNTDKPQYNIPNMVGAISPHACPSTRLEHQHRCGHKHAQPIA